MLMPDDLAGGSGGGLKDDESGLGEPAFDTGSALEQIGEELFTPPAQREYNRDKDGKFAQKAAEPVKTGQTPVQTPASGDKATSGQVSPGTDNTVTQTVQPAAGEAAQEGQPGLQPLQAPKTWTKDALSFWEQTPPRVQAEILKREADMHKGLQQYREAAQVGQTFAKTLEPFVPALQKYQLNPSVILQRALNAHLNLTLSPPDVKVKLFRGLAQDYGIDLDVLMDDVPYDQPQVSQETLALQQEVAQLRQALQGVQQHQHNQHKSVVLADVNAFADNPEHIYFEELADDITQLLQQGVAKDLKTAYEKAIWLNPTVREKELARQAAARQAKAAEDEAARLEAARKASAPNVRTQARPTVAKDEASTGDMEDTLKAQMRAIRNRG